ncbi:MULTISPECIES: MmgE/PrpD family protein [unclassified Achromobacter]|uniref:MmgE/PrpD family protein n=1 Tax=unclassified Achromobacter TaxID=2626865 RepID=UPI001302EAC0|nr:MULTISPECIES: MmgE/PrpD family protein [unclassified Achromobacter]
MQSPSLTPPLARQLAELVLSTRHGDLPALSLEHAKMSLASTLASAAVGYGIESARIVRELDVADGGTAAAALWFDGGRLPLASAARVNAVASDAAASDDSDMRSIAHIGTIISSVALAVGEREGAGGRDVLTAMVLGYEVAGRIDESLTPVRMQRGFHGSYATVFGACIAAGVLLRLDARQLAQAIALSATSIGGMAIAADTSWAREYHAGLAASTGIRAALAAQCGFESELAVLERPRGFLDALGGQAREDIVRDWGESWDIVTDLAIKLMPGAHPFHATAEAAANAARAGGGDCGSDTNGESGTNGTNGTAGTGGAARINPGDIARVVVSAAVQWTNFKGDPHPRNLVDAAHSLHYFVAAAIVDGGFSWQHMDEARMADPVVAALQDKVEFDPAPPPLPDRFPHRHGGTVTLHMKDGAVHRGTCIMPRGSGARGIAWRDVEDKFLHLFPQAGLAPATTEACLDAVVHLERADSLGLLVRLLSRR